MDEQRPFDSLADLFTALAAKLDEVNTELRGDVAEFRRGDVRFAAVDDAAAEVRLHPEIAEAARHTASAGSSERGPEWVRFAPPEVDSHALDRAEAWFLSAWRAAGQGR